MREPSTQRARILFRQYSPVVWWAADVELYSAIARSLRFGSIDASEAQSATAALDRIRSNWREIVPGDDVRKMARDLLDIYPLKAADSLQLAAALTWCDNRPAGPHLPVRRQTPRRGGKGSRLLHRSALAPEMLPGLRNCPKQEAEPSTLVSTIHRPLTPAPE